MNRRYVYLSLIVLLVAQLIPAAAFACSKECDVERSCKKTESGVRCTIIAKGESSVDELRKCARSCATKHHSGEGDSVTFEEIEGGIAVIRTGADAATIKALQAHADGCAKGHKCCGAKAHADHGHADHDHGEHASADKGHGCVKPCSSPCKTK